MRLFGKKAKLELPPLITDEELFPSVNFESVLDWLAGLSPEEYTQVMQISAIQRQANYDAAKVLGKEVQPTTLIDDPKDHLQTIPALEIDKEPKYLLEDEKPKKKTGKVIKVKD